jgi:chromate reductase
VTSCVAELPLFNPDIAPENCDRVDQWVREVRAAHGIIVSTPEYARGYPGALKNAFDWLVSTDAFVNKPFMLLNASARSIVAQQTLTTVLETMSGVHVLAATTTIPLLGTALSAAEIAGNPETASLIETAIATFVAELKAIEEHPSVLQS